LLLLSSLKISVFTMMLSWFSQEIMCGFRTCYNSLLLVVHAHSAVATPCVLCTKEIQPWHGSEEMFSKESHQIVLNMPSKWPLGLKFLEFRMFTRGHLNS
jgi:hypothetical protein